MSGHVDHVHLNRLGDAWDRDDVRFVLDAVREGAWALDARGRVVGANHALARWLESDPETLVGLEALEFTASVRGEALASLLRGGSFEAELRSTSGMVRLVEVHSRLKLGSDGRVVGAVQVVHDLSGGRAIEARLVGEVLRMARLAGEDPLTGLPNRRAFDLVLSDALAHARTRPFGLIVIDLDGFKTVNDTLGHEGGDRALAAFAERLRQVVRDCDFIARIGGDEFGAVLRDVSPETLREAAERIAAGLTVDFALEGWVFTLGASLGAAHSDEAGADVLSAADQAMYRRKRTRDARAAG